MNKTLSLVLAIAVVSGLALCTQEDESTDSGMTSSTIDMSPPIGDTSSLDDEDAIDIEDVDLPTPTQMASILNQAGLEYQADLCTDPAMVSEYVGYNKKVLNFGAYNGDLSYCVFNNEREDAVQYLRAVGTLAEDLGFSSIIDVESMLNELETNVGDEDGLGMLLEDMEDELELYADNNDIKYVLPVIFSGGWIESMYLASNSLRNEANDQLESRLVREMMILDDLLYGLKANPKKDQVTETLITDLEGIKNVFKNFAIVADLEAGSDDMIAISDEELNMLADAIATARTNMITP